jgi:hypothetical protein
MAEQMTTAPQATADPGRLDLRLEEDSDLRWEELASEITYVYNCTGSAGCYGSTYAPTNYTYANES